MLDDIRKVKNMRNMLIKLKLWGKSPKFCKHMMMHKFVSRYGRNRRLF